jgi:hypothetical protein
LSRIQRCMWFLQGELSFRGLKRPRPEFPECEKGME